MIVPSMTVHEIHKEVFEDIKTLEVTIDNLKKDFKRFVLHAKNYPVSKTFECKTREKKNLFVIEFTALKRSAWKKPIIGIYGIYSFPEGKYAVATSIDLNLISLYSPHFFRRYRERIVKDESISNEDIIRHYFKNDWGSMLAAVNENYESVLLNFEIQDKDYQVSFVGATSLGYCFGVKQGNINIIKTIISKDMLFENQKKIFAELRSEFNEAMKGRFGVSI